jgi:hypothetical protein
MRQFHVCTSLHSSFWPRGAEAALFGKTRTYSCDSMPGKSDARYAVPSSRRVVYSRRHAAFSPVPRSRHGYYSLNHRRPCMYSRSATVVVSLAAPMQIQQVVKRLAVYWVDARYGGVAQQQGKTWACVSTSLGLFSEQSVSPASEISRGKASRIGKDSQ